MPRTRSFGYADEASLIELFLIIAVTGEGSVTVFSKQEATGFPSTLPTPNFNFVQSDWRHRTFQRLSNIKQWLTAARTSTSSDPAIKLALDCIVHHQWDKAAAWLFLAATKGDKDAMAELGAFYLLGAGVPENEEIAQSWLLKSGGIMSGLLRIPYPEYAAGLAGKKPMQVEVTRTIYDPKDSSTSEFHGRPVGKLFSMIIDPHDLLEKPVWSQPIWYGFGNNPGPQYANYDGAWEQSAVCTAYFNLEEYERQSRGIFSGS